MIGKACTAIKKNRRTAVFLYAFDNFSDRRGTGHEILSTSRGYVIQKSPLVERVFKVRHTTAQTEDELSCIVDLGGTVVDVFVWHKVYGKIEAALNIFSPMHVKQFMEGARTGKSTELMHVTGGYHYHTVRADSETVLDRIESTLAQRNYIVPEI
jgi:transcriptional regulator of NAD metabolism